MKIDCLHGYFYFHPENSVEVARFNSIFGQDLISDGLHYTFSILSDFPEYSVKNNTHEGFKFNTTFEGKPHEIFEANRCCYNFLSRKIVSISSISNLVKLKKGYGYVFYDGLILPGSVTPENKKIIGYRCRVSLSQLIFNYGDIYYG